MRRAVEKYGGELSAHAEDGVFRLRILIPLAEQ